MHGLRALILALALVSAESALAVSSVGVNFGFQSSASFSPAESLSARDGAAESRQEIVFTDPAFASGLGVTAGFAVRQRDYSKLSFLDSSGKAVGAPGTEGGKASELGAKAALDFTRDTHRLVLAGEGTASASPFPFWTLSTTFEESFYEGTTVMGLGGTFLTQGQPKSYFVDRDFALKARPTEILGREGVLTLKQVLSERWKGKLALSASQRMGERPLNVGAELKQVYTLSDRWFVSGSVRRVAELRGQSLQNERGYFDLTGLQAGLTYEPWVDFLVTGTAGALIEDEEDPRVGTLLRSGTDQYGLSIQYTKGSLRFDLSGSLELNNGGGSGSGFSGGLTWVL